MVTMDLVIVELYKAFNEINKIIFENTLPQCMLTVQSTGKDINTLGWFTVCKVWVDEKEEQWEINMVAEYLSRPYIEIMSTLIHEMVHLENANNNIEDVKYGGYHNKKFAESARKRGLIVEFYGRYGFAFTKLNEKTEKIIEGLNLNKDVFKINRVPRISRFPRPERKSKPKVKQVIWECNCLRLKVGGDLDITCNKCKEKFKLVEN